MKLRFGFFGPSGLNSFQNELGEGFIFHISRQGREYKNLFPNVGQPDLAPPVHTDHCDDPAFFSDVRAEACSFKPYYARFTAGENHFEYAEIGGRIVAVIDFRDEACFFSSSEAVAFGKLTRIGNSCYVSGIEWGKSLRGRVVIEISDRPFRPLYSAEKPPKLKKPVGTSAAAVALLPVFFNLSISRTLPSRFFVPVNKAWTPFIARLTDSGSETAGPLIFAWDAAFSSIILADHDPELAKKNLIAALDAMRLDGRVPQLRIGARFSDRSNPPIWFLAAERIFEKTRDREFVRSLFDDLVRNYRWFKRNRMGSYWTFSWGADDEDASSPIRMHGKSGAVYESGLDDSPLFDGMELQEGKLDYACIDLTCLIYRACEILRLFCGVLGRSSEEFDADSELFRKSIHLFFDFGGRIANSVKFGPGVRAFAPELTPVSFYPLLTPYLNVEEVDLLRELYRSRHFRGAWPMPSLSYRSEHYNGDGDYWRGRIWPPMVWLVARGFRDYAPGIYREIKQAAADMLLREWKRDGHVHENYSSLTGYGEPEPGKYARSCPLYSWGGLLGTI